MKPVRVLLPVALLALGPLVTACGGDDAEAKDDATTSSSMPVDRSTDASTATPTESSSASTPTSSSAAGTLPAACDVVKKIDIATAYGVTPAAGTATGGGAGCSFTAKRFLTAAVTVSDKCPSATVPSSKPVNVKGSTQAMWGQASGDPFSGELVACTGDGVGVVIELDFEPGYQHEGDPKAQTISLAETVLQRLV